MRLEYFDNLVDYCSMDEIYRFCKDSNFKLGWKDGSDEKRILNNLHSNWSFEDLKNSRLLPFVNLALKKSKKFNHLDEKKIYLTALNLVTPADTFYIHTHTDTDTLIYYANLHWEDGWEGETMFYDKNNLDNIIFTTPFKPGRMVLFDGSIPHTIGAQSISGPKYRFTVSIFFHK